MGSLIMNTGVAIPKYDAGFKSLFNCPYVRCISFTFSISYLLTILSSFPTLKLLQKSKVSRSLYYLKKIKKLKSIMIERFSLLSNNKISPALFSLKSLHWFRSNSTYLRLQLIRLIYKWRKWKFKSTCDKWIFVFHNQPKKNLNHKKHDILENCVFIYV